MREPPESLETNELPRAAVSAILNDYNQHIIADIVQLIKDMDMNMLDMDTVALQARRTALLNAIDVLQNGYKYIKTWYILPTEPIQVTTVSDLVATDKDTK